KQMFDLRIPGVGSGGVAKVCYVLMNVAPVKVPGETSVRHLRIVIRDVTERLETEQIRKDFVANASHELRTPLSIINGYVENLMEGVVEDPEAVAKALEIMKKHGDRLGRIVEDMLMISKLESLDGSGGGVPELRREVFSIRDCIGDVVERLTPMVEEREVKVVVEVEPGADEMEGDRFYWDQVFFNLMENAMKENPGRGLGLKVTGRVTRAGGREITVEDDGVGIGSADVPFVFKRFYRVAKHHSKKVKGTGLGLSIVKRAVEAHGGTIRLSSVPGVRTAFTMELPPPTEENYGVLAGDDG
ncbi:MAG: ATP-binding protein, partial [Verrucomicrobiales bacterium]|nr:ATP-binding protein [Verrucomicrobiales bacterium]